MSYMSLLFFIVLVLWVLFTVHTLMTIRQRKLDNLTALLWVAIILCAPILGIVAFWLVDPQPKLGHLS